MFLCGLLVVIGLFSVGFGGFGWFGGYWLVLVSSVLLVMGGLLGVLIALVVWYLHSCLACLWGCLW